MKLTVVTIGHRLPDWANEACEDYLKRFPPDWKVEVKALKAEPREGKPVAVINIDDAYGRRLAEMFSGRMAVKTYGSALGADFRMLVHHATAKGSEYELEYKGKSYLVRVPLIGKFNMYNSLAALAAVQLYLEEEEAVLAQAAASEARWLRGEPLGALDTGPARYAQRPCGVESFGRRHERHDLRAQP